MTAWLYTDNGALFDQGKNIAESLGFDMQPFRNAPRSNTNICEAGRAACYDQSFIGQSHIAVRYGVDFFVFEKRYAVDLLPVLQELAEYQNEHFVVVSAERLQ